MRILFGALAVAGILMASRPLYAQDYQTLSFYRDSIQQCIEKCERKALMMDSRSNSIRRDAAIASMKAAFFKTHKEGLVNEMTAMNVGVDRARVDYFLGKSFGDFCASDLAESLAQRFQMMTAQGADTAPSRVVLKQVESEKGY